MSQTVVELSVEIPVIDNMPIRTLRCTHEDRVHKLLYILQ